MAPHKSTDVDHFDFAKISFLQELQRIEIVPFDEQILRDIKVDAFFPAWPQGLGDGRIGGKQCFTLAGSVEVVALLRAFHDGITQLLVQLIKVHR